MTTEKVLSKAAVKAVKEERIVEYKEEIYLAEKATKLGMEKDSKIKQPQKH